MKLTHAQLQAVYTLARNPAASGLYIWDKKPNVMIATRTSSTYVSCKSSTISAETVNQLVELGVMKRVNDSFIMIKLNLDNPAVRALCVAAELCGDLI